MCSPSCRKGSMKDSPLEEGNGGFVHPSRARLPVIWFFSRLAFSRNPAGDALRRIVAVFDRLLRS